MAREVTIEAVPAISRSIVVPSKDEMMARIEATLTALNPFTSREDAMTLLRRVSPIEWRMASDVRRAVSAAWRGCVRPAMMPELPNDVAAIWVSKRFPWLLSAHCARCNWHRTRLRGGCILCHKIVSRFDSLRRSDVLAGMEMCRANPREQGPKLILADWFEERGYCDLAGVLRGEG